jgi:hypothetical protein
MNDNWRGLGGVLFWGGAVFFIGSSSLIFTLGAGRGCEGTTLKGKGTVA